MSIASRITSIEGHIGDVYDTMALGGDTTANKNIQNINTEIVREYKDFLGNGTGTLWSNWEKVTGSGTSVTLNNTMKGNMRITLNGNTGSRLPSGYTEVEYLESTGTQYINTGVQTSNSIKVEVEAINTFGFADQYNKKYGSGLIGARVSATDSAFFYNSGGTYDFIGNGSNYLQITKNGNTDLLKMSYSSSSMTINCGTYQYINTGLSINITSPKNIYLFAFNNNGTATRGTYKIYKCKIYNNNTLIRDFVPCYNSSNVRGLYDLVNDVFYTNAGSGTFTKGADTGVGVNGNNTITIGTQNYPINLGDISLYSGDKIQGTRNSWEILRSNSTTIAITDETLIYQLNDLYQNATSSNTTTSVTQTNDVMSFILNVTALKEVS